MSIFTSICTWNEARGWENEIETPYLPFRISIEAKNYKQPANKLIIDRVENQSGQLVFEMWVIYMRP